MASQISPTEKEEVEEPAGKKNHIDSIPVAEDVEEIDLIDYSKCLWS